MDPRRLAYLDEMGIQVWVRRGSARAATDSAMAPLATDLATDPPTVPVAPPLARSSGEVDPPDWEVLEAQVRACQGCALHETRNQVVFGVGDQGADWLFVGEAPGADEDRQGEPFVGRAGQLLTNMIRALGMERDQVYIANILKCRPPGNRDPQPQEAQACRPYLQRQIALQGPKVIVALGRVAAQKLLQTDQPLGRLRGRPHGYPGSEIPVVVTYHPAYLLRSPREKAKAWEDLCLARRLAIGSHS